jgi:hypothetical protein
VKLKITHQKTPVPIWCLKTDCEKNIMLA